MKAVLDIVLIALDLYVYVLIAGAIISWLIVFNIINTHNGFIQGVTNFVYQVTEPFLAPIRRRLPYMNGLDLSPIVLILAIYFLKSVIIHYVYPNVF